MKFNSNFYQNNVRYTREQAEAKLLEKGYTSFTFKSASYANGSSFYFDIDGKDVRVSDHQITGKRAFNTIQISFKETKELSIKKTKENNGVMDRLAAAMLKKGIINK